MEYYDVQHFNFIILQQPLSLSTGARIQRTKKIFTSKKKKMKQLLNSGLFANYFIIRLYAPRSLANFLVIFFVFVGRYWIESLIDVFIGIFFRHIFIFTGVGFFFFLLSTVLDDLFVGLAR